MQSIYYTHYESLESLFYSCNMFCVYKDILEMLIVYALCEGGDWHGSLELQPKGSDGGEAV